MTDPIALAQLRHLYQNMVNGAVRDTASAKRMAEGLLALAIEVLERATPPAEQQAAPKVVPGVGNSGFDHQTAADFLNGKTVSDEAVRKFVQASRWAHDEKASLSAMLISVRGELASREAEIALLKKALLKAEEAPQPAPAPLSEDVVQDAERYRWLRDFHHGYVQDELPYIAAGEGYDGAWALTGEDADKEIDAALAAQGGSK